MLRLLLPLAALRLKALRRPPLDAPSRAAALSWLAHSAPRYAGRPARSLATLSALLFLALLLTSAATLTLAYFNYIRVNDSAPDSLPELLDDAIEYEPEPYFPVALVGLALLLASFFLSLLLWLRLGCLAALRARAHCSRCQHDLTALPIRPDNTVHCPECAHLAYPIAPWHELAPGAAPESPATFRPNLILAPRFWTRRRLKLTALSAASLALLAAIAFGGHWLYIDLDARRQAAQARAARLSPDEITRRVLQRPESAIEYSARAADLIPRAVREADSIFRDFNDRIGHSAVEGDKATIYVDEYSAVDANGNRNANRSALALELLMSLRTGGIFDLLDQLPFSDPLIEFSYDPKTLDRVDIGPVTKGQVRSLCRIANRRAAWARIHADLGEFVKALKVMVFLNNFTASQPTTIDHLVRAAIESMTLSQAARTVKEHPNAAWLDAIDRELSLLSPAPLERTFERERVFLLDRLAHHFSDPARIKRGLTDPELRASLGLTGTGPGFRSNDADSHLGTFAENLSSLNSMFDDLVSNARLRPFQRRENTPIADRKGVLVFRDVLQPIYAQMMRGEDRLNLSRQAFSVLLQIERYRLAHDRYPTPDEFAAHFANDPNAVDPYTGRLLRYRLIESEPRAARPAYQLWSTGTDAIDNNGNVAKFAKFGYEAIRPSGAGTDYLLSDPERW